MIEIIRERGMGCRSIRYVQGQSFNGYPEGERVLIYGSIGFVRDMMRERPWVPTAWFDEQVLSCHEYYGQWNKYLLQRNYRFIRWGELPGMREQLYKEVGSGGRLFIRPDDNLKSFAGSVVEKDRFDRWYQQSKRCYDLLPSLLCLVASPQDIVGEWRVVIVERKVLTASAYIAEGRRAGDGVVPDAVIALANQIAGEGPFDPLHMYVMDIGQTSDGFFLMEIGSVNCSSLYGCDLEKVVDAASGIAAKTVTASGG